MAKKLKKLKMTKNVLILFTLILFYIAFHVVFVPILLISTIYKKRLT